MPLLLTGDKIISAKDATKLLRHLYNEAEKAIKAGRDLHYAVDYYLIAIAYNTGLRISEIHALDWGDVSETFLIVREGKGKKTRTVHFGEKTSKLFNELRQLKEFQPDAKPVYRTDAVFIGQKGRLSLSQIHRRFKRWVGRVDLSPSLSFHALRHGYATRLLDEGVSLSTVRDQLGHSNISITSTYLHFTVQARERILAIT